MKYIRAKFIDSTNELINKDEDILKNIYGDLKIDITLYWIGEGKYNKLKTSLILNWKYIPTTKKLILKTLNSSYIFEFKRKYEKSFLNKIFKLKNVNKMDKRKVFI